MATTAPASIAADTGHIKPFIDATVKAFRVILCVDALPREPEVHEGTISETDISAIVGLSGDARGTVTLGFPDTVANRVVSTMLGTGPEATQQDLTDAIGELANIVVGSAKRDLGQYRLDTSLPKVVLGRHRTCALAIVVPFTSEFGEFVLEVMLSPCGAASDRAL